MADHFTVVRLSPLSKIIAARMTEAKQTIPHFRLVMDVEWTDFSRGENKRMRRIRKRRSRQRLRCQSVRGGSHRASSGQ